MKFNWQLSAAIVLLLIGLWWWYENSSDVRDSDATKVMTNNVAAKPVASTSSTSLTVSPLAKDESVKANAAQGGIHFKRSVKNTELVQLDLNVRDGFGVWLPQEKLMRVLLVATPLTDSEIQRLTPVIAARIIDDADMPAMPVTYSLLELRFQATAQAFDRDELVAAQLLLRNTQGLASTANVLDSVEWQGSLPSRQVNDGNARATTVLQLSAKGHAQSDDGEWDQSWQLALAVPVTMVD